MAKVCVNGTLSNIFTIKNCTHQGCTLSPILFILTLDPFLRRIRENADIKGVFVGDKQYKLAAFADDILLFLTEPHITLPNLLKDLSLFQFIAHFKINYSKTQALNITLPDSQVHLCKSNFQFLWHSDAIIYLGISLRKNLSNFYSTNYIPIIQKIRADLKNWNKSQFS